MTNFVIRNHLGEVIGAEVAESDEEAKRKFLSKGECDLKPDKVSATMGSATLGVGAKVTIAAVVVGGAALGAYALGLFDRIFQDSRQVCRRDPAPPRAAGSGDHATAGGVPDPAALPAAPREYVFTDTSHLALSRFRELAGIADRAEAIAEIEAANPGIDLSSIAPGVAIRIPPTWPERRGLYRQAGPPGAAPPPASPPPAPAHGAHGGQGAPPAAAGGKAPEGAAPAPRVASPLAALVPAAMAIPSVVSNPAAAASVGKSISALALGAGAARGGSPPAPFPSVRSPLASLIGVATRDPGLSGAASEQDEGV